jgi:hypothetical protein
MTLKRAHISQRDFSLALTLRPRLNLHLIMWENAGLNE